MNSLVGGIILGISSSFYLAATHKIMGMSGIIKTVITQSNQKLNKLSLLLGIMLSTYLMYDMRGVFQQKWNIQLFDSSDALMKGQNSLSYTVGGLLIGIGTHMANGCTSGHGVCGIPRLSIRSLVSVVLFMISAVSFATTRHYYPFWNHADIVVIDLHPSNNFISLVAIVYLLYNVISFQQFIQEWKQNMISIVCGFGFGTGLIISGMARRSKIMGFLVLSSDWDYELILVMIGAILFNLFSLNIILMNKQQLKQQLNSNSKQIDSKLIVGSLLFGVGWGMTGLCPGPMFILLPFNYLAISMVMCPAVIVGMCLVQIIEYDKSKQS